MIWSFALWVLTISGFAIWPPLEHSVTLPSSHTVTGFVQDLDGTWWAGNDGRMFEGDDFRPGIVHLSANFKPISEIKLGGHQSLQGVALVNGEVWAAYYPTSSLERFTKDGRHLGSVKLHGHPNGLAFDGRSVIVTFEGEKVAHWYGLDGRLIRSQQLLKNPDHLAWRAGKLWYSSGENGKPGCVLSVDNDVRCFKEATAIEGFAFTHDGQLMVASDGYFHNQRPKRNQILIYRR